MMNYNRSLVLLQNYEDGTLKYASTNNLQNSLGIGVSQNVTFTGGVLTAYSDLSRIDQFGWNTDLSWYSQPVTIVIYAASVLIQSVQMGQVDRTEGI